MSKPATPPEALRKEYREFIEAIKVPWCAENRSHSKDVYEVMSARDRDEVHGIIARWARHITPIAEAWWRERGYGIVWPSDDSQPEQYYKLEIA